MLQGIGGAIPRMLRERLPAMVFNGKRRAAIRAVALAALGGTLCVPWWLQRHAAVWYICGVLNGALLLPLVLLGIGERLLRSNSDNFYIL